MSEDPVSLGELRRAIPARLFQKDELRFLISVGYSLSLSLAFVYLALNYLPLTWWAIPIWIAYAITAGTVWTGVCNHKHIFKGFWDTNVDMDLFPIIKSSMMLLAIFCILHF
jgi:hypothetical protein